VFGRNFWILITKLVNQRNDRSIEICLPLRRKKKSTFFYLQTEPSKIIDVVTAHVKPNSTIVTSHILYPIIKNIQGYSEVINIKTLMTFDPAQHEKSLKNIGNLMNIPMCTRRSFSSWIFCLA
jgi:hypothetical protein